MADEVKLNDAELGAVDGGAGPWQNYAKGTYVNYGSYLIYTVASGDVLTGRNVDGNPWHPDTLTDEEALSCQQCAHEAIFMQQQGRDTVF